MQLQRGANFGLMMKYIHECTTDQTVCAVNSLKNCKAENIFLLSRVAKQLSPQLVHWLKLQQKYSMHAKMQFCALIIHPVDWFVLRWLFERERVGRNCEISLSLRAPWFLEEIKINYFLKHIRIALRSVYPLIERNPKLIILLHISPIHVVKLSHFVAFLFSFFLLLVFVSLFDSSNNCLGAISYYEKMCNHEMQRWMAKVIVRKIILKEIRGLQHPTVACGVFYKNNFFLYEKL